MIVLIPDFLESLNCLIGVSPDFNIAAFFLDLNFILGILELRILIGEDIWSVTYLDQTHRVKKIVFSRTYCTPSYSSSVVEDVFVFVCSVFSSWLASTCSSLSTALLSSGSASSPSWIVSNVFDDATVNLKLLWM